MLILNDSVYFPEVHPVRREKISKFVFDYLGAFKTLSLGNEHPRFLNEAALVANASMENVTAGLPQMMYKDSDLNNLRYIVSDPHEFNLSSFITSKVISGSYFDAPINFDVRFLYFAKDVAPVYAMMMKNPALLSENTMLTAALAIQKLKDIQKTGFWNYFSSLGDIESVNAPEILAKIYGIPLASARNLMSDSGSSHEMFFRFKDVSQAIFIWPQDSAKIYEVQNLSDKDMMIAPFVSLYPYASEATLMSGMTMASDHKRANIVTSTIGEVKEKVVSLEALSNKLADDVKKVGDEIIQSREATLKEFDKLKNSK
jgi:hypothetical protein